MMTDDLVRVFQTADSTLLPIIKSMLDGAGIPHIVQGDHALGLLPLGPFGTGVTRGLLGAIILVPREHAAAAKEILNELPKADADEAPEQS
jgi:hypothetical protein